MRRHGELLAAHFGEDKGMRDIRKHIALVPARLPGRLRPATGIGPGQDARRARLRCWIGWTRSAPFPEAATGPRGRQGSPAPVALPEGWLNDPDDCTVPAGADVMHSGG